MLSTSDLSNIKEPRLVSLTDQRKLCSGDDNHTDLWQCGKNCNDNPLDLIIKLSRSLKNYQEVSCLALDIHVSGYTNEGKKILTMLDNKAVKEELNSKELNDLQWTMNNTSQPKRRWDKTHTQKVVGCLKQS